MKRFGVRALAVFVGSVATVAVSAPSADAPQPAPKLVANGAALLRDWTPPVYPAELLKQRRSGMVSVRLIVDATGHVTAARALEDSDAAFVESALTAVKAWGFEPAIDNNQPVACSLDTLVTYSPAQGQLKPSKIPPRDLRFDLPSPTTPEPKDTPTGDYPPALAGRLFAGRVRFDCTVSAAGRVQSPRILAAAHVEFVRPALAALEHWEFSPSMQGDLAVASPMKSLMAFDAQTNVTADILVANGITAPDGSAPPGAPEIVSAADPVWPYDLLVQNLAGTATVEFTVNISGYVEDIKVAEASCPAFGESLAASMEYWSFNPALERGQAIPVRLRRHVEFKPFGGDAAATSEPDARILTLLKAGTVGSAKGLDARLIPIYRVAPDYPLTLRAPGAVAGRAELEIVIDRDGRVRLPRVVSATRPEFGWAAANAIAQWVFQRPRRNGEPVDVRVRIPFDFAAPKS